MVCKGALCSLGTLVALMTLLLLQEGPHNVLFADESVFVNRVFISEMWAGIQEEEHMTTEGC